jgi:hypothetical protein
VLRVRDAAGDRILVVGDEGGSLVLTFLAPVLSVSITFGGDDPAADAEPALLVSGSDFTGFDTAIANENGAIDQTLSVRPGELPAPYECPVRIPPTRRYRAALAARRDDHARVGDRAGAGGAGDAGARGQPQGGTT